MLFCYMSDIFEQNKEKYLQILKLFVNRTIDDKKFRGRFWKLQAANI